MLRAQMSIMGLYHYNNDIFDNFIVPEEMDKDNAIIEILSQCAELELVYPDYDVMKTLIGAWTKSELPQWERALKVMTIEYNPIWNVDANESETITRELSGSRNGATTGNVVDENIDSTKGYNSNNWTEADKSNGTSTSSGTSSDTQSETETVTTEKTRNGNIGVTMSQQLVNAELDLLLRLNPYQYIVDSFKRRFCLLVY